MTVINQDWCSKWLFLLLQIVSNIKQRSFWSYQAVLTKMAFFGKMAVIPEWQLLTPELTSVASQNDHCRFPKWPVFQLKPSHFDSKIKQNILNENERILHHN